MSSPAFRILILRFSSLGDVVLASSLIPLLEQQFPDAQLLLATKSIYAPLFAGEDRLAGVESLDERGLLDLLRRLEHFEADWIVDAHGSLRSRLLCALLPPARVSRVGKDALARLAFVKLRLRTRALAFHQLDRYARLVGTLPQAPRLSLTESARTRAAALAPTAGALAIAPGARHASKQWLPERFAACARRHAEREGLQVLVIGSAAERELCEQVAHEVGGGARSLAGQCELDVLAAVLERCTQLLCNDSGLMHLSEAVGTPVTALFGPTSREFGFYPSHPASQVVEHALACRPCSRTGARPCHMPERWCMTRSSVELVASQLGLQAQRLRAAD